MPPNFHIASTSDAGEIAALVNRAYRPVPSSRERGWTHEADWVAGARVSCEQVLALFGPGSAVLILRQAAAIVACVHVQATDSSAYIGMLATEPAVQAQGLGKQMLAHAERYAVEHFNAVIFKMSVLSSRAELISFYERRGYARTGEIENYPLAAGVGQPMVEGLTLEMLVKPAHNALVQAAC